MDLNVIPFGGLCNRMTALASAYSVSNTPPQLLKNVKVLWQKNRECYASFYDLFQYFSLPTISSFEIKEPSSLREIKPSKHNLYVPTLIHKVLKDREHRGGEISNKPIEEWLTPGSDIYVYSCHRIIPSELCFQGQYSELFQPTDEIQERIKNVTCKFSDHTVGVHIRRTDNIKAIQNSPLESYFSLMDREIQTREDTKFYIASDDEGVKTQMRSRYGKRIITEKWELKRDTVQGMKDAVAELYCLGSTSSLIGSTNSTYSLVAAKLYNIPILNISQIKVVTDC